MQFRPNRIYSMIFKEYPDILDVKQVSKLLDISTKTAYRLISEGEIPCIKVGREYRIPKTTLIKYINVMENKSREKNYGKVQHM